MSSLWNWPWYCCSGGIGVAYALPQNTIAPSAEPWAGTASIEESGDLSVTDYSFIYNQELTQVTAVRVELTNSGRGSHQAEIAVAILDSGGVLRSGKTLNDETCPNGASDHTATLTEPVALENVDKLNILIADEGWREATPIPVRP